MKAFWIALVFVTTIAWGQVEVGKVSPILQQLPVCATYEEMLAVFSRETVYAQIEQVLAQSSCGFASGQIVVVQVLKTKVIDGKIVTLFSFRTHTTGILYGITTLTVYGVYEV